jgi:predicted AlkP superfamily phosphohydrolase/phosphomutase
MSWVDPDTRQSVVDRVVRSDEAYPGGERDALPDLFILWNRERPIGGLSSPAIGVVRDPSPLRRSGNHVADGFYIVAGPSVTQGGPSEPVPIVDLGPTLAAWLGEELPGVSGRPIGA